MQKAVDAHNNDRAEIIHLEHSQRLRRALFGAGVQARLRLKKLHLVSIKPHVVR
jgi:hypothetical protein